MVRRGWGLGGGFWGLFWGWWVGLFWVGLLGGVLIWLVWVCVWGGGWVVVGGGVGGFGVECVWVGCGVGLAGGCFVCGGGVVVLDWGSDGGIGEVGVVFGFVFFPGVVVVWGVARWVVLGVFG